MAESTLCEAAASNRVAVDFRVVKSGSTEGMPVAIGRRGRRGVLCPTYPGSRHEVYFGQVLWIGGVSRQMGNLLDSVTWAFPCAKSNDVPLALGTVPEPDPHPSALLWFVE